VSGAPNIAEAVAEAAPQPLSILILEDVAVDARLVESELRRGKIQFVAHHVSTRDAFVAAIRERGFDLILADYKLPGFDGIAALAIAQEVCPSVPFILISGQISEEMAVAAVSAGATDYILKDHMARLLPSVHRTLREVRERMRRRLAEDALRASEERYRLLVERSRDGILQFDRQGRVVFVNPRGAGILGCERERFASDPGLLERLAHGSFKARFIALLEQVRAGGSLPQAASDWLWMRPDGTLVFTENLFTELIDDHGRVIGFQMALRDVTDKKKAEVERRRNYQKLRRILGQTVNSLSSAVEMRDPYTGGHQQRVAELARRIAEEMKLSPSRVEGIFLTGLLHDIGKINVPAEILSRPGPLGDAEKLMIRSHPEVGYRILKDIEFPWPVAVTVVQHHEHLDGTGYPAGLSGGQIILEARILAVSDVLESMASHRPYRPALGLSRAIAEITQHSGSRYDPAVVETTRALLEGGRFQFHPSRTTDVWVAIRPPNDGA